MKIETGTSCKLYTFNEFELEQHEAEIRKPLEEEIKRLKFENKNIQNAIKLVDEAKYTAQQDDITFFVSEERQRVIADLEEWLDEQPTATYWLNDNESEEHLPVKNIKEKLKEMKEV